jgi:HD-GYP domain-containing protein (c-di-GMP phosphodiesterase class II)
VVLSLAGAPVAGWASAPVVAAALAAQIACDAASATASEWFALRVSPRDLARPLAGAFVIDILLAPVGFAAAIAERNAHGASALPLPVLLVLVLFARERRRRLDNAIELSTAYRGTAFLLGDVVEADDAYTGHHSRQVVDLVLDVCDRLRLDERSRRDAEFVALLHDVGKIRIPTEIIGKPGPLTLEERAVIETHTVEGERLLKRVGGLLAEIGTVVRSCHERWDGAGYPDGLAGDAIPLIARIVCACDAFDAMTSDRPYRPARSTAEALGELVANRGTQFDPRVVDALVEAVVAASTAAMTPAAFDVCPGCGRTTALAAPAAGGQVVCVRCGLVDAAVAAA